MTGTDVQDVVRQQIEGLLQEADQPVPALSDEDILLETGLDSLGFAVLITRLEDILGYDPFTEMSDPVYPQTLGELTAIYKRFEPSHDA